MRVNGIILAAGASSRFKGDKLLTPFRGRPLLAHILEATCQTPFHQIVLVIQESRLQELDIPSGIQVVLNKEVERGISYSIALGINNSMPSDAYMFIVGDQPFLSVATMTGMLAKIEEGQQQIITAAWQGRRGNPVIFSSHYKPQLIQLEGDNGGKQLIARHEEYVVQYPVLEQKELMDIDTWEDYKKVIKE